MTSNPFEDAEAKVNTSAHKGSDVDTAALAIHHTLGLGANQAAAGNHGHAGIYEPVIEDTGWHEVGAVGEPPFLNGWVNYGGFYSGLGFRKRDRLVQVRGMAKSGNVLQAFFTLPVAYRPATVLLFNVMSNGTNGRCDVYPDGTVLSQNPNNNTWVSLNGLIWWTD